MLAVLLEKIAQRPLARTNALAKMSPHLARIVPKVVKCRFFISFSEIILLPLDRQISVIDNRLDRQNLVIKKPVSYVLIQSKDRRGLLIFFKFSIPNHSPYCSWRNHLKLKWLKIFVINTIFSPKKCMFLCCNTCI